MGLRDDVEAMRAVPLLRSIDAKELRLLAMLSEEQIFEPGETMIRQGEEGGSAYILFEGLGEIRASAEDGRERMLREIGPGAFVGEMAILLDTPRTATVLVTERIRALRIEKDVFLKLLRDFPDMSLEVMRELAQRLLENTSALMRE